MAPSEVVEMIDKMTDEEFHKRGLELIGREFGVGGLARFIRTCRAGSGDYTRDRHQWQDSLTVQDVIAQL